MGRPAVPRIWLRNASKLSYEIGNFAMGSLEPPLRRNWRDFGNRHGPSGTFSNDGGLGRSVFHSGRHRGGRILTFIAQAVLDGSDEETQNANSGNRIGTRRISACT